MLLFRLLSSLASIITFGLVWMVLLLNMEFDDGELNLEGDDIAEVVEGIGDMVVMLVEVKGLRRLADFGKSKMPPLLLFWPEFNGGIVVQHAIVYASSFWFSKLKFWLQALNLNLFF
jgi:hypothetical protein